MRMASQKGAPGKLDSRVPVTVIQPRLSWIRNTPVMSSAPRAIPKKRSSHHPPLRWNPKSAKGRRSSRRPASHTLRRTPMREAPLPMSGSAGEPARAEASKPPEDPAPRPATSHATASRLTKRGIRILLVRYWRSSRSGARSRPVPSSKNGFKEPPFRPKTFACCRKYTIRASVDGQRAARVADDVLVEHPLYHVGVGARYVLVHIRVFAQVVEPGLLPVVAAEHGEPFVPGPDEVTVAQGEVGTRPRSLPVEQPGEVLALHGGLRLYAEEAQDGWGDVVG